MPGLGPHRSAEAVHEGLELGPPRVGLCGQVAGGLRRVALHLGADLADRLTAIQVGLVQLLPQVAESVGKSRHASFLSMSARDVGWLSAPAKEGDEEGHA